MTENHDRALGRVEGKINWLINEQLRASESRRLVHKELEAIRLDAAKKNNSLMIWKTAFQM